MAYSVEKGVGSGIPGTTKFDEVASAAVNGFMRNQFDLVSSRITPENLGSFLDAMSKKVTEIYGLTFKEGTLDLHLFEPDQPHYDFEFLGQTLLRVVGGDGKTTHYVPKPKLHKLLLTATSTRKAYASINLQERSFQTIRRSLVANGGYLYPMFYESTKALYERKLEKNGIRPLTEEEEEYEYQAEGERFFEELPFDAEDYSFPSLMRCMNLFLPHGNQLKEETRSMNEHLGKTTIVPTIKPKMVLTVDSDDEEEADETSPYSTPDRKGKSPVRSGEPSSPHTPEAKIPEKKSKPIKERGESKISQAFDSAAKSVSGNWAEQTDLDRDMFEDIGGIEIPFKPRVPLATQELKQPLPQAVKDAYTNKIKDETALRKAMREKSFDQSKATTSRKKKKGSSSKHVTILDFDDPSNFDPDISEGEEWEDAPQ
jgi:hypothetical protein